MSCWEPFCYGIGWSNLGTDDSLFFAGRYYFTSLTSTDSIQVFDPLNDTTYAFFNVASVSNSGYTVYQYFHAYTDAASGNSYLLFTTNETYFNNTVGMSTAIGDLPADANKTLSEDITIISSLSYVRDYFRGYYPKMLR